MKKLSSFLFLALFLININAQKLNINSFNEKTKIALKKECSKLNDLIDLRIDSIKSQTVTKWELDKILNDHYSLKISILNDKIEKELDKVKSLNNYTEKQLKLDEIDILTKESEDLFSKKHALNKKLINLDNYEKDIKTKYIIVTKINYYLKTKDPEETDDYERYFFYTLSGKPIDDIYKHVILE